MSFLKQHVVVIGVEPASLLNFRKDLLLELVKAGHQVTAVAMNPSAEQIAALRNLGVETSSIEFSRAGMNPLRDLQTLFALKRLFGEIHPHCIIAYTAKPVIYAALAARLAGVPKFCAMITGLGYSFIPGSGLKRRVAHMVVTVLYRVALKNAATIIFQNPDDLATFEQMQLLPKHSKVGIVNGSGVDLNYFKKCALPKQPIFLMIARLLADKGVREYASAAERLRKKYPEVRTLLVGGLDPSPNSVTQSELDGWRVNGLEYFSHVNDVRPLIAQASVIVLPSYREGTPRSVLEGMAMGRAIITTDAPGCRETVKHEINGLLVEPRSPESLFAAMDKLTTNPVKVFEMAKASYEIVKNKYEGKAVAKSVLRMAGFDAQTCL
jgi:glycosyltransferase involved in cell wall biosynthesis